MVSRETENDSTVHDRTLPAAAYRICRVERGPEIGGFASSSLIWSV